VRVASRPAAEMAASQICLLLACCALAGSAHGDEVKASEHHYDKSEVSMARASKWADGGDGAEEWATATSPGARQLLAASVNAASKHVAVHAAAVKHASHKKSARGRPEPPAPALNVAPAEIKPSTISLAPSGVSLPKVPRRPPVCSVPPAMRFCKNINYPVYRPDDAHTFADVCSPLTCNMLECEHINP